MKLLKKLFTAMFALTLVIGTGTRVNAQTTPDAPEDTPETFTITINKDASDKEAHTYGAYQIFTGDLADGDSGNKILSNIDWGTGVTKATLITELKKIEAFKDLAADASAAAVAKAIGDANLTADSAGAQQLAEAIGKAVTNPTNSVTITADATTGEITGLPAGYYLVKDTAAVTGEGASTRYILQVVDNVTVTEKADVPSVEKKVKEKNDSEAAAEGTNPTDWQDGADYDIGDYVPFKITGKTAGRADEYYKYHVTFIDDQSEGLDAPKQFKITVLGEELTLANEAEATATVTVEKIKITASIVAAGADFQIKVAFENTDNEGKTEGFVKLGDAVKSQDIVVEYTSKLNESAVIGTPGNPNEVNMKFSNNPNLTDDSEEGETPKDKVVVFTYEIKALKVEPDGSAIDQTAYDALSDTEKANYVKVGDKWQKTKPLATAGFTLFKKVDASNLTDEQKSGAKSEYEKATKKGDVVKDGSDYYIAVKDEIKGTDTFKFEGTDAGAYKLVETTVPSGYNKAEDITITVAATYDTKVDNPKLKTLTVTPEEAGFTVTTTKIEGDDQHITTDGIISGKILNEKGSVLPSTGGIGTTIFYVLGGLLIFGAGIVLVARRKASE